MRTSDAAQHHCLSDAMQLDLSDEHAALLNGLLAEAGPSSLAPATPPRLAPAASLWLALAARSIPLPEYNSDSESDLSGPSGEPAFPDAPSEAVAAVSQLDHVLSSQFSDASAAQGVRHQVRSVLQTGSADVAAAELAELLGFDHLELASSLVQHTAQVSALLDPNFTPAATARVRQPDFVLLSSFLTDVLVVASQPASLPPAATYDLTPTASQATSAPSVKPSSKPYTPGAQLVVRSADELRASKAARAAARRDKRARAHEAPQDSKHQAMSTEEMLRIRQEELMRAASRPAPDLSDRQRLGNTGERYPHVFSSGAGGGNSLSAFGTKFTLPQGTYRDEHKQYEEITVPPPPTVPPRMGEGPPVLIKDMNPITHPAFKGYESLNRLQSAVYPLGYGSNENLLVCAPTGAGKTDVAMLTVLRAVSQHCHMTPSRGWRVADAKQFKMVYVAPMKALAAEVVRKFSKRLGYLGVVVKELTGDMQLTRKEMDDTHMLVTTPEKWDVVTRKPGGDHGMAHAVRLLIIDEVHLLSDDRGAVIETIVARTLRQVERSQSVIRIVGLSATLPNYVDVADFLRVNRYKGMFYFDSSFRPVPLEQHFIGVRGKPGSQLARGNLDKATFDKVLELTRAGNQVMVFVHARKETVKAAQSLRTLLGEEGEGDLLAMQRVELEEQNPHLLRDLAASKNRDVKDLYQAGFGIHHAGMLRSDRTLSERLFESGLTRVLCCTATLAWGVNLPAYAVIIKGTDVFDAGQGKMVDLSILDVLQIFGRAGRPQYEDRGVGYICTAVDKLGHYVEAVTSQHPIESAFTKGLADALNAEVALGTVASVQDAMSWLSYTYLQTRMRKAPILYGLTAEEVSDDPHLGAKRRQLVDAATTLLTAQGMVTLPDRSAGTINSTSLGRIAARYYIGHLTVAVFNSKLHRGMSEADLLSTLTAGEDFAQLKARDEEMTDLTRLVEKAACEIGGGGVASAAGKANALLQAHISRLPVDDSALVSEMAYVAQNSARILRALVELAFARSWGPLAHAAVGLSLAVDKRLWPFDHPLRQFPPAVIGGDNTLFHLIRYADEVEVRDLAAMSGHDVGTLIHLNDRAGDQVRAAARQLPYVTVHTSLRPIMGNYVQADLVIVPNFDWNERVHHGQEPIFVWLEQDSDQTILQFRSVHLHQHERSVCVTFLFPLAPSEASLTVHWMSDRWIGAEDEETVSLRGLVWPLAPSMQPTDALDLPLVPTVDLQPPTLSAAFDAAPLGWGNTLNPLQTRASHTLLRTTRNTLLAFPARSGGTTALSLALFPFFLGLNGDAKSQRRALFIGPDPSRLWSDLRMLSPWVKSVATLSNDMRLSVAAASSVSALSQSQARVLFSTPRTALAWVLGRMARTQGGLEPDKLDLILLDSVHLLSPEYELAISLLRLAAPEARIVASTTSLADPSGVAQWIGADSLGVYAFQPPLRPVGVHHTLTPVDGTHSHALLQTMIKPAFDAVKNLTLDAEESERVGGALLFVPSRAAAQVVADGLATLAAGELDPLSGGGWMQLSQPALEYTLASHGVSPLSALARTLVHGVAVYDEQLSPQEKKFVLNLFFTRSIRALVLPRWAAWSTNLRSQLVVVLGTQYMRVTRSGETERTHELIDYSAADLVRMHSLASAPAARTSGHNVLVLCQPSQVSYYDAVLRQGQPLESWLLDSLLPRDRTHTPLLGAWASTLLALVEKEGITSRQDALDLWGWTLASVRTRENPSYYGLSSTGSPSEFSQHITDTALIPLQALGLIAEHTGHLARTPLGEKVWPKGESMHPRTVSGLRALYAMTHGDRAALTHVLNTLDAPRTGMLTASKAAQSLGTKKVEDKYDDMLRMLPREALRAVGLSNRIKRKGGGHDDKDRGAAGTEAPGDWSDSPVRRLLLARWLARPTWAERGGVAFSQTEHVFDQLEANVVLAAANAALSRRPNQA